MIKTSEKFLTHTLSERPWGRKVARILAASLEAVDPESAINRALQRKANVLITPEQSFSLDEFRNISLLALGKAGIPMACAAADLLSDQLSGGAILTKPNDLVIPGRYQEKIKVYRGGHPIPNLEGCNSTKEILSDFSGLTREDLVLVLLSGGGSALFTSPAPGLSLQDLQHAYQTFLDHGLDIQEINTIRKHLSRIKGGQLSRVLHPARTITLILSDVIGDRIDMIASGPTVPDPTTYEDALEVIRKYQLEDDLPASIYKHLLSGAEGIFPETPKPGDPIFQGQSSRVIAGIQDAIKGGCEQAQKEGFNCQILPDPLEGEARLAGKRLVEKLIQVSTSDHSLPICLIAGGETTVTLTDAKQSGKGGRNLELALSAVRQLAGRNNAALISLATDGEDGVTDAAGAIATGDTLARAEEQDLNPEIFLANHDSYTFFEVLDDLLLPGSTGTNVNDLCFLFTF